MAIVFGAIFSGLFGLIIMLAGAANLDGKVIRPWKAVMIALLGLCLLSSAIGLPWGLVYPYVNHTPQGLVVGFHRLYTIGYDSTMTLVGQERADLWYNLKKARERCEYFESLLPENDPRLKDLKVQHDAAKAAWAEYQFNH